MLSKNTRWALAVVGVLIIVVAAVVIGTGSEQTDATHSADHSTTAAPERSGATGIGATGASGASGKAAHPADDEDASGGASADQATGGASPVNESGGASAQGAVISPVFSPGKIRVVKADKGDTVVIRVKANRAGALHVHGYDEHVELVPGKTVKLTMKATIDGEFPIEFHFDDTQEEAGTLRVNP